MNILILDDQPSVLRTIGYSLKTMGHKPFTVEFPKQARRILDEERIDAMFVDVNLGSENGLEFLKGIRADGVTIPAIVFTAEASIESAVEAMRQGAYDYIQKPFLPSDISQKLLKLEETVAMKNRVENLEGQISQSSPTLRLESSEPAVQRIFETAFRAAQSEAGFLILGPSGTGKTVLARAIHERSGRSDRPFVTINCPSLSRELLESELFGHVKGAFTGAVKDTLGKVIAADGGTLFLDEIGELPLEIQPKLLRLLQDREFERLGETRTRKADVRVMAASNRDLKREVDEGRFREDLFYRLKVITLEMPALVDRPGDLPSLADGYLKFFAAAQGRPSLRFSNATRVALSEYPWPGNLRELRNVIERAVILAPGEKIEPSDLPDEFRDSKEKALRPGHIVTIQQLEEEHIRRIIAKATSLERASEILGIDSATLYRKRKKLGMV